MYDAVRRIVLLCNIGHHEEADLSSELLFGMICKNSGNYRTPLHIHPWLHNLDERTSDCNKPPLLVMMVN